MRIDSFPLIAFLIFVRVAFIISVFLLVTVLTYTPTRYGPAPLIHDNPTEIVCGFPTVSTCLPEQGGRVRFVEWEDTP